MAVINVYKAKNGPEDRESETKRLKGMKTEWLHQLRQSSWLLSAAYGLLAFLISATIAYLFLRPASIAPAVWEEAPSMALPYRIACTGQELVTEEENLLLLVSGKDQARHLLGALCQGVASLHVGLEAYWGLSDDDRRKLLKEGRPAIVFGRAHLVESRAVSSLQSYREVAHYPSYTSNLIAKSPIELSRRGLSGKKIGLLEDQSSRSGRLVPVSLFRKIGLNSADYVAVLADSHSQLRDMLAAGQVDIIASYWGERDKSRHPDWMAVEINAGIEGARWYMRPNLTGSPFSCIFQRTLLEAANKDDDPYFSKVELVADDC